MSEKQLIGVHIDFISTLPSGIGIYTSPSSLVNPTGWDRTSAAAPFTFWKTENLA